MIPFVAFAVLALLAHIRSEPLAQVWRKGIRLWSAMLALTALWVGLYLMVVDQQRWSSDLAMTWDLLQRSVTHGIVPGLAGGPWQWNRGRRPRRGGTTGFGDAVGLAGPLGCTGCFT